MPIEPEKEIVMILAKSDATETITDAIRDKMRIDEPGRGILFTLGVGAAYGLR
jgi:hypothetical protein